MDSQTDTNKQITLAEALSKIESLTSENEKLTASLETANTQFGKLETEFFTEKAKLEAVTKSLAALENKHRDIDKEVAVKVAEIAAQSGVEPIKNPKQGGDEESIEDLAKRIDTAQGIEKARLIEANTDRILAYLRRGA